MRFQVLALLVSSFCLSFAGCGESTLSSPQTGELERYIQEHPEAKSTGEEPAGFSAQQELPK